MAFIRSKNIKGNEYLYLVRSVRQGEQVRQKVLKYLGPKGSTTKKDVPREYRDEISKERKVILNVKINLFHIKENKVEVIEYNTEKSKETEEAYKKQLSLY